MNYKKVAKNEEYDLNMNNECMLDKKEWTILSRDIKTNKTIIDEPEYIKNKKKEYKLKEKTQERHDFWNIHRQMITNWNNYRDKENELSGDVSRFINYKDDLKKLEEEDRMIEEKIIEYNNISYDSDNSDDESNKYLLY